MSDAQINARLNLHHDGQDWGILTADKDRLEDYIDFWLAMDDAAGCAWDFWDLCLASAAAALDDGQDLFRVQAQIVRVPYRMILVNDAFMAVEYWIDWLAARSERASYTELSQLLKQRLELARYTAT